MRYLSRVMIITYNPFQCGDRILTIRTFQCGDRILTIRTSQCGDRILPIRTFQCGDRILTIDTHFSVRGPYFDYRYALFSAGTVF